MKAKFTYLLMVFLLAGMTAKAQQSTTLLSVKGQFTDENFQPVALVTVQLFELNKPSGDAVQSIFSDDKGFFLFHSIPVGEYFIRATSLGYQPFVSDQFRVAAGSSEEVKLDAFVLKTEFTELSAVTVTSSRPLVERRPDMLVVNVENSTLSAGNSALEILERSPGIVLDKDDNISLMGKQGVLVMINGKQTNLSSDQLASYLRNMDGNTIKSIELITNPSSKYEASGSSGIINIVLKRSVLSGTNGTVAVTAGFGLKHKSNTSLNLSHKTELFNVYGTVSYLNNGGEQLINLNRNVKYGNVNTNFLQSSHFDRLNQNFSYRTGVDFHSSDRNTLTFEVNGNNSTHSNNNHSQTSIGQGAQTLDSTLLSLANGEGVFRSFGANLNNEFILDSSGRKLVAQADISQFVRKMETAYDNSFFLPDGLPMGRPALSQGATPTTISIRMAKVDYTHPVAKGGRLETGLRYSQVLSDNEMAFTVLNNDHWESDPGRSNQFIYDEHISAAYANYQQQFGKLGMQAGIRAEHTHSTGRSITLNSEVTRDYIDLFPSVFLSYAIDENHQTGLSYSKRINRPNYNLMNPFSYFLDQYTSERGNPYLQPEYAQVFEATYSFKSRYHLSLGWNRTNDAIVESMGQDDELKTTYVTRDNLAKQTNAYVNLSVPVRLFRYWNNSTNINGFYLGFEGNLENQQVDRGQFALNVRNSSNFTILPTLTAELNVNYSSPLVYSIYRVGSHWSTDIGLSKSLMQRRASLKLAVSDVFLTRKHTVRTDHANLDVLINQKHETRIARLTFSYSFGKTSNQRRETRVEEKNRVGNL